ncbi:hypothetical protein [Cellulomonas phragmiteti]|uniref:DUF4230 domain-containing protein n=1 Tax=Cellulomonas phragmiteti TaxID=478780 RepID=A0ABQ4DPY7_9CELL|nr:hypothetical protein [Cellulomonas phragmiteti]GIG41430.1 hypothetical protein Cph01nite_31920 [Cellulomonas phragmiteti]
MTTSRRSRTALWLLVAVCLGALVTYVAMTAFSRFSLVGSASEERDTRVVTSVTRQEQVVLLSLGIEGIAEQTERGSFLGMDIPGSGRSSFVQYGFNAKLGIEGKDVRIVPTGEGKFRISVPEFIFIGHDDESFRTVVEDNGVLSWVTPQIDVVEMINTILDQDAQSEYVEANTEILQDQARVFYTGIVQGIDPTIELEFEFR